MNQKTKFAFLLLTALLYIFSILMIETVADPVGTVITNVSTVTGAATPASRVDDGGTISILQINVTQQNYAWKAYVGNISATLTLDDNNGYTIYDWSLVQGSLAGELYVTRNASSSWSGIACASGSTIDTELNSINMSPSDGDTINTTFNHVNHSSMVLAGTTIDNSTCRALHTYYNGSSQGDDETSYYEEILIQNTNGNLIYVTNLEADKTSYVNDSFTYDFQLLVAEDDRASQITTYYFYAEIDS
ncbi:MAG: hypothetical protein ABH828_03430 [archaeon]